MLKSNEIKIRSDYANEPNNSRVSHKQVLVEFSLRCQIYTFGKGKMYSTRSCFSTVAFDIISMATYLRQKYITVNNYVDFFIFLFQFLFIKSL